MPIRAPTHTSTALKMVLPSLLVSLSEQPGSVQTCEPSAIRLPGTRRVPEERRSHRFYAPEMAYGRELRLARGAGRCHCGRCKRWRTQCSKVRSDGVRDGPSLRSQAVTRSAVYPSLSSDGHPPSISLPRAQELPRLILSLHFFTSTLHTHYPLFT